MRSSPSRPKNSAPTSQRLTWSCRSSSRVDETLIRQGTFGLIQQYGVGLETVDIDAATRNGVMVARIPSEESGNAASVAEHAILLMLMLSRRWNQIAQTREQGTRVAWGSPAGQAMLGKTVCILGLGGVGRELARRLSGFRVRIVTVDDHPGRTVPGVEIARSYPLEQARRGTCGSRLCGTLHQLHPGPVPPHRRFGDCRNEERCVHRQRGPGRTSRSGCPAFRTRAGQVAGAGLDVFWDEPVDMAHPVFRENVIATPHIAGVTDVSYESIAKAFAENMKRYAAGEKPLYLANAPARLRAAGSGRNAR